MSEASGRVELGPGMFLEVKDCASTRSISSVTSTPSAATLSPKKKWLRKMSARSMEVRWKLDVLCGCPAFMSQADADQRTEAAVKFQRVTYAKGERIGAGIGRHSQRTAHGGAFGSAQRTAQNPQRISIIYKGRVEVVLPLTKRATDEIVESSRRASAAASAIDLVQAAAASAAAGPGEDFAAASEEETSDMPKPGTPVSGSRPGTTGSSAALPPLSRKNSWSTLPLDSAPSGGNAWHAHDSLVINTVMEQERQRQRCDGETVVLSRQSLSGSSTSAPFVFGFQRKVVLRKPPPPPPPKASVTGCKPKQPAPGHNGSEASNPLHASAMDRAGDAGEAIFASPDHAFDVEAVAIGPVEAIEIDFDEFVATVPAAVRRTLESEAVEQRHWWQERASAQLLALRPGGALASMPPLLSVNQQQLSPLRPPLPVNHPLLRHTGLPPPTPRTIKTPPSKYEQLLKELGHARSPATELCFGRGLTERARPAPWPASDPGPKHQPRRVKLDRERLAALSPIGPDGNYRAPEPRLKTGHDRVARQLSFYRAHGEQWVQLQDEAQKVQDMWQRDARGNCSRDFKKENREACDHEALQRAAYDLAARRDAAYQLGEQVRARCDAAQLQEAQRHKHETGELRRARRRRLRQEMERRQGWLRAIVLGLHGASLGRSLGTSRSMETMRNYVHLLCLHVRHARALVRRMVRRWRVRREAEQRRERGAAVLRRFFEQQRALRLSAAGFVRAMNTYATRVRRVQRRWRALQVLRAARISWLERAVADAERQLSITALSSPTAAHDRLMLAADRDPLQLRLPRGTAAKQNAVLRKQDTEGVPAWLREARDSVALAAKRARRDSTPAARKQYNLGAALKKVAAPTDNMEERERYVSELARLLVSCCNTAQLQRAAPPARGGEGARAEAEAERAAEKRSWRRELCDAEVRRMERAHSETLVDYFVHLYPMAKLAVKQRNPGMKPKRAGCVADRLKRRNQMEKYLRKVGALDVDSRPTLRMTTAAPILELAIRVAAPRSSDGAAVAIKGTSASSTLPSSGLTDIREIDSSVTVQSVSVGMALDENR